MTAGHLAVLGLAGAAGALARVALSLAVTRLVGPGFPLGTLAVNLAGCVFFGAVLGVTAGMPTGDSAATRLIVLGGFAGAFTTFSTFAADNVALLEAERYWALAANIILQNVLGVLAVMGGYQLGTMR